MGSEKMDEKEKGGVRKMINLIFGIVVGFILSSVMEYIMFNNKFLRKYWDHPKLFFKYHFHHSFYGLIIAIVSLIFNMIFLAGVGIGMIISHTIADKKLVFIEKH